MGYNKPNKNKSSYLVTALVLIIAVLIFIIMMNQASNVNTRLDQMQSDNDALFEGIKNKHNQLQ